MVRDALIGLAVGDALGVPVEFKDRSILKKSPVTGMQGFGSHRQVPGTWSDDSSLTFCLAEVLAKGFDLNALADSFIKWLYQAHWTAHGTVFDVGNATREAIRRLREGCAPEFAGGMEEDDNGNGSLMRILPLVFYTLNEPIDERFRITKAVSSLTHAHARSIIACFYYLEFARQLLLGTDKTAAYKKLQKTLPPFFDSIKMDANETALFRRLLIEDISVLNESDIRSSGYVLHTLEASIWCVLTTSSYPEAVLRAVNLGSDTDTTGAVTGGLAGILYGFDAVPPVWVSQIALLNDILELADELSRSLSHHRNN